ncbi:MAG: hypothetical protein MUF06_07545, partial [Pirellulaceae bacterium]|nr:hypothetical protein [Pirellulaceae bacterium]
MSYWSGDNTAADSVGTNHGTLINGTGYATGQVGSAFRLDGVDDRIGVADAPTLALTGSISIEAWVKANAYPAEGSGHGLILFRGDDRGGLDPYQLTLGEDGLIKFQISSLSGGAGVQAPLPVGQFVHVAGTLDDATGEMKLYLNGVLVSQSITAERPFGPLDPASNPGVGIGSHGGYPSTPHKFLFNGLIDELKLYDHALTGDEVRASFFASGGQLQVAISDVTVTEGATGTVFLDAFVQSAPSGLDAPRGMTFHNGDLYVISGATNSVLRYGPSGEFLGEFVTPNSGGLDGAFDLAFGPDGDLYVNSARTTHSVLRYDGNTGAFIDQFVVPGAGGLLSPRGLLFGPDQNLYVASQNSGQILRFQGPFGATPGAFMDEFASTDSDHGPFDMAIGPDGHLYVAVVPHEHGTIGSQLPLGIGYVARFDGTTGASMGTFVPTGTGGLVDGRRVTFDSAGNLLVGEFSLNSVLKFQ